MSNEICDGCGQPARRKPDGSMVALKKCSACRTTRYHDVDCQRAHHPHHKASCKAATLAAKNDSSGIQPKIAAKIVDRVRMNRVTIVVGPTGSGKSTKVPPLLLNQLDGPILCTQPRRLAVVAIAKRVASERGTILGGADVGYHVGNHNLSTHKTRLLFTTAGILLEEMRANGVEAVTKFKCCIIDECHERSPESDLVLGLIKQFMISKPKAKIHLVLMSATFDHERYAKFFRDVPNCAHIDTITLQTAETFDSFYANVSTYYLEDVSKMIPDAKRTELSHFFAMMKKDANLDLVHEDGKALSPSLVSLVGSLAFLLDKQEANNSPFLIFAPTYRHLDQIFFQLSTLRTLHLCVLHSSIDIEDCLRNIGESGRKQPHVRYVFLASAIADSSITVPDVTCVIDLCRTLEIKWNVKARSQAAKVVWASHSICDQRRGRTGRTCPGRVFRLVPKGFYVSKMDKWDVPQIRLSSCHNESISVVCSSHDLAQDPRKVLNTCLDPPKDDVVKDAIDYLIEIGACVEKKSGLDFLLAPNAKTATNKVMPTPYGSLLGSLPLAIEDAKTVVQGGTCGMLHEALILQAIASLKPLPIVQKFGEDNDFENKLALMQYFPDVDPEVRADVAIAHLAAYFFWDLSWNLRRRNAIVELSHSNGDRQTPPKLLPWTPEIEEEHIRFCSSHLLNPTSLRSIDELIASCYATFYLARFEPEWLQCVHPTPLWKRPGDWKAGGLVTGRYDMINRVYGPDANIMIDAFKAFVSRKGDVSAVLPIIQELDHINPNPGFRKKKNSKQPEACIHFLLGNCKYGSQCRTSHSPNALPPMCRFYPNCTKGDRCVYSHGQKNRGNVDIHNNPLQSVLPVMDEYTVHGEDPMGWFEAHRKKLMMLGEGNFRFTSAIAKLGCPPAFASTLENTTYLGPCPIIPNVSATSLHSDDRVIDLVAQNLVTAFAWNFPFTGQEEDTGAHEVLMLQFFQSAALIIHNLFQESLVVSSINIALTLQGDQFSRWNVRRAALRAGFRLVGWCPFDFPSGYTPSRASGEPFAATDARFYTFVAKFEDLENYPVA